MSELTDLQDYYAALLIIQYRSKPKASDTIKALVNQSLCDGLPLQMQSCWDLDTAAGAQLTILGRIVGVPRDVIGLDLEHTFFEFTRYSGTPVGLGFGRYNDDPYSDSLFLRYGNRATYTLTDFELRALIRLKIIYNNTYSSFADIKEALYAVWHGAIDILPTLDLTGTFFKFTNYEGTAPGYGFGRYADSPYPDGNFYLYQNYKNMTITYQVETIYENMFKAAIFLDVVPRPMGVELITNYV